MKSIDRVFINKEEKIAVVVGVGIPTQVINDFEFEGWDTIKDFDDEPLFDLNVWNDPMPKTCPTDPQEWHIGAQYCGLVKLEKPIVTEFPEIQRIHVQTHEMDNDYQNPNEVIITEQPMTTLVAELIANSKIIKNK